jgi:hypothetical protein
LSVRSDETLYHLEIRSQVDVQPDHPVPTDLVLIEQHSVGVVREATLAIGQPYDWPSQS